MFDLWLFACLPCSSWATAIVNLRPPYAFTILAIPAKLHLLYWYDTLDWDVACCYRYSCFSSPYSRGLAVPRSASPASFVLLPLAISPKGSRSLQFYSQPVFLFRLYFASTCCSAFERESRACWLSPWANVCSACAGSSSVCSLEETSAIC